MKRSRPIKHVCILSGLVSFTTIGLSQDAVDGGRKKTLKSVMRPAPGTSIVWRIEGDVKGVADKEMSKGFEEFHLRSLRLRAIGYELRNDLQKLKFIPRAKNAVGC